MRFADINADNDQSDKVIVWSSGHHIGAEQWPGIYTRFATGSIFPIHFYHYYFKNKIFKAPVIKWVNIYTDNIMTWEGNRGHFFFFSSSRDLSGTK